ncbi:MAG: nucleotidyl transferase AbiEii/AbiGii toxin family protein [Candidatus Leucobacter sulfamidivorax]|nr:nucleotidyl transferase AbiEii/AbiGii toxin family protein [Candidatus Leucobacter sulfamidivorax]
MSAEGYPSSSGVEQAIRDAARRAHEADPSVSVQERVRQEIFRRLLSRVFSEPGSDWILKGGTGVLARVQDGRSTLDIDLFRSGFTLEQSLVELRRLAEIDLADHFSFIYRSHEPILAGDQQIYTEGLRIVFDVYLGAKSRGNVKIDLVAGTGVTDEIVEQHPVGALDLPRLPSSPYRLYPVVNQIADKICATLTVYPSGPSTREKDLVDLVVLATTQEIHSGAMRSAIRAEAVRRHLPVPTAFVIPEQWGLAYARMARETPACADYPTAQSAMRLMDRFLDQLLDGAVEYARWDPHRRRWEAGMAEGENACT